MGNSFRLDVAAHTALDSGYGMNPFPNVTWDNAIRLVVDGFLLAVGWSAGCWLFNQLMGWGVRSASKQ